MCINVLKICFQTWEKEGALRCWFLLGHPVCAAGKRLKLNMAPFVCMNGINFGHYITKEVATSISTLAFQYGYVRVSRVVHQDQNDHYIYTHIQWVA